MAQQECSLDAAHRKAVDTDSQEETIWFLGWQISAPVWIPPTANIVPEEEIRNMLMNLPQYSTTTLAILFPVDCGILCVNPTDLALYNRRSRNQISWHIGLRGCGTWRQPGSGGRLKWSSSGTKRLRADGGKGTVQVRRLDLVCGWSSRGRCCERGQDLLIIGCFGRQRPKTLTVQVAAFCALHLHIAGCSVDEAHISSLLARCYSVGGGCRGIPAARSRGDSSWWGGRYSLRRLGLLYGWSNRWRCWERGQALLISFQRRGSCRSGCRGKRGHSGDHSRLGSKTGVNTGCFGRRRLRTLPVQRAAFSALHLHVAWCGVDKTRFFLL